ncbi:MAG: hypothetical protein QOE17_972 [Gaiellales bacterium]|nr:hypothetical protein [Gaiellales bacterium]
MRSRAGWLALCLATLVACLPTEPAGADGDPASDFLLITTVFVPFNKPSQPQIDRLKATVAAAEQRGYEIRVAVIGAPQDLGAVPDLFGRPSTYARFLGSELVGQYRGRLLVVMPQGYGFSIKGKADESGAKPLVGLAPPAGPSSDDLTAAAAAAVRALALGSGVQVPVIPLKAAVTPGTGDSGSSSVRRWLLFGGVGAIIVAVVVLSLLFWPTRGDAEDDDEPDPD